MQTTANTKEILMDVVLLRPLAILLLVVMHSFTIYGGGGGRRRKGSSRSTHIGGLQKGQIVLCWNYLCFYLGMYMVINK